MLLKEFSPQPPADLAFERGFAYVQAIQPLAPTPTMVEIAHNLRDRGSIYRWIGQHIEGINFTLNRHLSVCHECFPWQERRRMQIFAIPLAGQFGIDGVCNLQTQPLTILIDVGRVRRQDWLSIVAHEYAHAHLGVSGHDRPFLEVLSHLCLGLGLPLPPGSNPEVLRCWPHYPSLANPLAFWRGDE